MTVVRTVRRWHQVRQTILVGRDALVLPQCSHPKGASSRASVRPEGIDCPYSFCYTVLHPFVFALVITVGFKDSNGMKYVLNYIANYFSDWHVGDTRYILSKWKWVDGRKQSSFIEVHSEEEEWD